MGLGRYNRLLNEEFGNVAGLTDDGQLRPLNSQLYEIAFDLGVLGLVAIGGALIASLLAVGRRDALSFTLYAILLLVVIQALTIQTLLFASLLVGATAALMRIRRTEARSATLGRPAGTGPVMAP